MLACVNYGEIHFCTNSMSSSYLSVRLFVERIYSLLLVCIDSYTLSYFYSIKFYFCVFVLKSVSLFDIRAGKLKKVLAGILMREIVFINICDQLIVYSLYMRWNSRCEYAIALFDLIRVTSVNWNEYSYRYMYVLQFRIGVTVHVQIHDVKDIIAHS